MRRRNRGARASDPFLNPNFSRRWTEPEPTEAVAKRRAREIGRKAIRHWLEKAEGLKGEDRTAALSTADQARELCGLTWADLFDRKAAA